MPCPACGNPTSEDQRFCSACGGALPHPESATVTSPAPAGAPDRPVRAGRLRAAADLGERFLPGQILADRYRMVGPLGRGGMGEVYRADDLKLGQPVALKFLPRDVERDPERLERFLAEVRLSLRVTHPNVCRVFDIGRLRPDLPEGASASQGESDRHFLSMEYVDGEDLASLLRRIGRLPEDKAVEIARQLCAGLAAAHENGVLHRDLKPSNIMIDGRGRARITDFGLAGATSGIAGREARVGTPEYMAPEQFDGAELSVRTDLYALGLVLYELFTGKRAFSSSDVLGMVTERASSPTSPSAHVSGLNPIVERAILRCLEPDPADRPSSASSLAAALPGGDPLAIAIAAGETPSPEMVARSGGRGELKPAVAVACLAMVLVGLVGAWIYHGTMDLQNRVPMPKPPAELRGLARAAIAAAGYPARPSGSTSGLAVDNEYLRHVERTDQSTTRWKAIGTVDPPPIWFWYRESAQAMRPMAFFGRISPGNPPMNEPGMIRVRVDPSGRLLELMAVPANVDDSNGDATEPDWAPLFGAAGRRQSEWTTATPKWTPEQASDLRRAWTNGDLRIEAAAFRGKPTWFHVIPPWRQPLEAGLASLPLADRINDVVLQVVIVALIIGGALLARRNIRQGRSDRRSATRLALVYMGLGFIYQLTKVAGDPASWFWVFKNHLGLELFEGGSLWIFYVAIEPYIRRLWPGTLVAWARALEGKLRDPMVGRHILFGALMGLAVEWVFQIPALTGVLGVAPDAPHSGALLSLRSGFDRLGWTALALQDSFLIPVGSLIFILICRVVFRRPWIASLVAYTVYLGWASLGGSPAGIVVSALLGLMTLIVIARLGLFAMCVGIAFSSWPAHTLTINPESWFFTGSAVTMFAFAAVAIYGFWVSLGGQKVFRDGVLN